MELLGRNEELHAIEELLDAARSGLSRVLVLQGEPGIGKTSLLAGAVAVAPDFQVARVAGVPAEADLGFAALHRLLVPFLERRRGLPGPQAAALDAAFGLVEAPGADRFLVGLATLTLLTDVAADRPLLCVVDDAQWLDRESVETLAFVARRLYADGVVLLIATHDTAAGRAPLTGLPDRKVFGLEEDDAKDLLRAIVPGVIDPQVASRVIAETQGNPLALVELSGELSTEQFAGGSYLPEPLPLGRRIEARFMRQVHALPEDVQLSLLLVAAEPSGDDFVRRRAARHIGVDLDGLERPGLETLVTTRPSLGFRHPLIRSAIYGAATDGARRRVHEALAEATDREGDPDRRAWHLAAARLEPDESVAAELERSAGRAQRRGGRAAVVAFLERAAELTPEPEARAERLLAAAQAALRDAANARAQSLLDQAKPALVAPALRARARRLEGVLQGRLGRTSLAPAILVEAAADYRGIDARVARDTMFEALEAVIISREYTTGTSMTDVARTALAHPVETDAERLLTDELVDGLSTRVAVGYVEAVPILRRAVDALCTEDLTLVGTFGTSNLGNFAAQELWDLQARHLFCRRFERIERAEGLLSSLPSTLVTLADCEMWEGRFGEAEALQSEACGITTATGGNATIFRLIDVEVLAWRGRDAETRESAAALIKASHAAGISSVARLAQTAVMLLEMSSRRYREAFELATQFYDDDTLAYGNQALPELVEAGSRCGELEAAAAALERLAERATASGTPWALGLLARSRALLSESDNADALYREAIDLLERATVTTEVARTHLVYGEWLRRENRHLDARQQLRIAHDMFGEMGASRFAERARIELLATGEHVRTRAVDAARELTPQEAQIAAAVAENLTNREIAAQLFISASTVDYHLRKVFRKLDVSSRRELARLVGDVQ